uniref:RING-type domain-containing protein n=1 Tax=Mesocestoides corti TaxID=53468 RepID=A0A5K3FF45_MESCO
MVGLKWCGCNSLVESMMRVDFGGVAQQKSCTPVDAEAPTKKACRVSEGDKSEPGEGIVVEEEGIGERGGGADSPDSVSIHRGWPSPVRVSGSLGYSFPSLPPLLVDTKSRNTLPTSRLSRPSKLTSGSALPRPSGLASRRTTTTTASVTDFAIRQTLNAREAKEVEEQLLCTSACEVEDLPPPQITLPTGATVTQENDRAPVVQPIHLPEDLSLSNSRLYQSMLETALMPPPAPPLKHRRGMFKGQAEPQTPSTAPVSSSLSNATTRRRSVQFAPVAEVMKQHPEGQWNRLSVAITEPCNLSPIPRVRESSDDDSSVDDSHCQNISILQASDTSDAEPRGRSRSRTSLPESSGPSVHETSGPSVRETRQSCEIDVDVDVESHWLPPADDGKEYDMSALRGVVRQGIMGWVEPEDPIFIPLRRSSQPQPPSESGVRRSSRIRIRPPRSSYERVYYGPRVNPKTGLPEIVPLGYLRYPDEAEARRRRRFLQRQRLRQHKPEAKAKLQRATKLRILAAKRRLLEGQGQGSPTKTVGLEDRLESDVVFVKDGTTSLPIGRLVHPEGPSDLPVVFETAGEAKAHLLGGVIQDYTVCEIAPGAGLPNVGPFEQSCHDITNVVSRKQKSRGLHFDAEANNLFTLNQPTSDQLKSDTVVFAVQIGTYAIPLSKPCSVLVPRGIPYKFVNSTSCTLSLIRLRFLPSDQ